MTGEDLYRFARENVYSSLAERYEERSFSRDLWQRMGRTGMFGLLIPEAHGGSGVGPVGLVEAIEAFVSGGADLGLSLSWLDHLLIHALVIERFGTEAQKAEYLPALAAGERIGALAASEPGSGANPVEMQTRAVEGDGMVRIDGRKIYITNGPVADFVIVLARTGPMPGKQGISAFLVDASTPGFAVNRMDLGFLQTSPHGELLFDGCKVPIGNRLAGVGDGHVKISRAVFAWERFLLMVTLATHFRLLFDLAAKTLQDDHAAEARDEIAILHVTLEGFREMARTLACEALGREGLDLRLRERLLFLAHSLGQWWDRFQGILKKVPDPDEFPISILVKDAGLIHVGQKLYDIQMDRIAEDVIGRVKEG